MKALTLASISLLALTACSMQPAPPTGPPGASPVPTTVGGSAANTTTAFDGTYRGLAIRGDSGAGPGSRLWTHLRDASPLPCRQP